ncbi:S1 family peptidase [Butyrivibrio sp. WCD2001]|uniref:S1 family peptidase n=1 Tax=Butyrivibrio sp. WCD2001 TaxID=1280681 RepID=UPI0003FEE151|nr:serine protease [Butyrivibrio sp. WCD2001]
MHLKKILTVLLAMLITVGVNSLHTSAQGPMPSEIAQDMLSIDAFAVPYNFPETNTEDAVIKTALNVRSSTVQIQVGKQYGTGNIISINSEKIRILTAAHVVQKWDNSESNYVIFFNGKVADANLDTIDDYYDAAIISVETAALEPYDLMNLRRVTLDYSVMSGFDKQKDETVIALESNHLVNAKEVQTYNYYGNDTGIAGKYIYGPVINPDILVVDYGYKMIYTKLAAHSGMSGGGIFDINGHYVGILVGGSDTGETVGVRLTDIKPLLSMSEH